MEPVGVRLKPGREKSLARRHPWIFSGAIEHVEGTPEPGATVRVLGHDGATLALAAWSPQSQIRLRVWSFDAAATIDAAFFAARIGRALARRRALGLLDSAACRLVFGEADGLPGLIVDRYGEYLVCQFLAAGTDAWRSAIVAALTSELAPRGVLERSDAAMRRKEGLPPATGLLAGAAPPDKLSLEFDGLEQILDLATGQKTGAYLDQRDNRRRVAAHARGRRVLDAYAYNGGFGLQCLAGGAAEVCCVDSSAAALEAAAVTAARNGLESGLHCRRGDVPAVLRELARDGRSFDLIVLDPPKFVQSAAQVTKGCRAYKDINRLAFSLLSDGGLLATFSCSAHVDAALFRKVVAQAAQEAGRDAQILEQLGQPPDHPVMLAFPEGEYLKGLLLRV